jgi:hypothetical protein
MWGNIKMEFCVWGEGVEWSHMTACYQVVGFCEYSNEAFVSVEGGKSMTC